MPALFWQFFTYSVLGFFLEVAFAKLTKSDRQQRKCHLLLPVCPVYGVGGVLLGLLPRAVVRSPLLVFLLAVPLCTGAEWAMALYYEKAAGAAFWDYSGRSGNLAGRICPLFSFFWGLLALPVVYVIHPWLAGWTALLPPGVTLPAVFLYLADALVSVDRLRRGKGLRLFLNKKLSSVTGRKPLLP